MRIAASGRFWPGAVVFGSLAASLPAAALGATDSEVLDEIIVTALKIREDVLKVPVSVQVLDTEFLGETDPSSLFTLQYDVPGLVVNSFGFFGAGVSLRGVTDQGGGPTAVAAHINGVYLGQSDLALARMFDMERVEVLKGPQGTLYGRNSTGGAVNFLTHTPTGRTSAGFEAAAGSFDTLRAEGHVNVARDGFALRLSGTASEGDGFIHNTVDDRLFAEEDYYGYRATLAVRPATDLDVTFFAQRVVDDGAANELWLPNKDYLPDPDDYQLTTVTIPDPYLDLRNDLAGAEIDWRLGDLDLVSVTGYAHTNVEGRDDCAGEPFLAGCVRTVHPWTWEQWSQEFRVGSSGAAGEWLAGLFLYESSELSRFTLTRLAPRPIQDYETRSDKKSWALFGQGTRRFDNGWSLTAGLRYSDDHEALENAGTGLGDDPLAAADESWDDLSWRFGAAWEPNTRLMLFASAATGYKSGGISTVRVPPDDSLDEYEPENLLAFEIGAKWKSADQRRSASVSSFYYDFENLQVLTTAFIDGTPETVVDNAAVARLKGLDLSAEAMLGERLNVTAAVVWLPEREFVEFEAANGPSLSGNELVRAPEWSATASAVYRVLIASHGNFSARADFSYRSAMFYTKENLPRYSQGAYNLLDAWLRYESDNGRWYLFFAGRNLLDTNYFNHVFFQTAPGKPRHYELGFGLNY